MTDKVRLHKQNSSDSDFKMSKLNFFKNSTKFIENWNLIYRLYNKNSKTKNKNIWC